jgi:hypothetical protein
MFTALLLGIIIGVVLIIAIEQLGGAVVDWIRNRLK